MFPRVLSIFSLIGDVITEINRSYHEYPLNFWITTISVHLLRLLQKYILTDKKDTAILKLCDKRRPVILSFLNTNYLMDWFIFKFVSLKWHRKKSKHFLNNCNHSMWHLRVTLKYYNLVETALIYALIACLVAKNNFVVPRFYRWIVVNMSRFIFCRSLKKTPCTSSSEPP